MNKRARDGPNIGELLTSSLGFNRYSDANYENHRHIADTSINKKKTSVLGTGSWIPSDLLPSSTSNGTISRSFFTPHKPPTKKLAGTIAEDGESCVAPPG